MRARCPAAARKPADKPFGQEIRGRAIEHGHAAVLASPRGTVEAVISVGGARIGAIGGLSASNAP